MGWLMMLAGALLMWGWGLLRWVGFIFFPTLFASCLVAAELVTPLEGLIILLLLILAVRNTIHRGRPWRFGG